MTVIASEFDVLTSNDIDLELRAPELDAPAAKKEWMFEDSKVWQFEAKKEWMFEAKRTWQFEDSKTWQVAA
jgi:hypothetical protein